LSDIVPTAATVAMKPNRQPEICSFHPFYPHNSNVVQLPEGVAAHPAEWLACGAFTDRKISRPWYEDRGQVGLDISGAGCRERLRQGRGENAS